MTDLLEPLVPPEVDLRDYDFMPLYGKRLFDSDTWNLCEDSEKLAALRLWWASWHQEPAGSLPDNDRLLCGFAGKGDVLKAFLVIKDNAMRGWIKCSDGRLYHPVVASIALDVWRTKRKKATDNAADRERKRRKRGCIPPDNAPISAGHDTGHPAENALKGSRREVEASPSVRESAPQAAAPPTQDPPAKQSRGSRLPSDWTLPDDWREWATTELLPLGGGLPTVMAYVDRASLRFRDHWLAKAGKDASKTDWQATWRNWIRRDIDNGDAPKGGGLNGQADAAGSGSGSHASSRVMERLRARFGPGSEGSAGADAVAVLPAAPGG